MESEDDGVSEEIIRANLEMFLPYICDCVQAKDLLFHLHYFTREQGKEIFEKSRGRNQEAMKQALDIIMHMRTDPERFRELLEAVRYARYTKVAKMLAGKHIPNDYHCARIVDLFTPELTRRLPPSELLPVLRYYNVIGQMDSEDIRAEEMNHGRSRASWLLLYYLPCREKNWFKYFLLTLMKRDFNDLARQLDPDLYEKLLIQQNECVGSSMGSLQKEESISLEYARPSSIDVHENIISDHESVPPDDNINAAPNIKIVRADISDAEPTVDTSKVKDFSSFELSEKKEQNVEEYKKQEKDHESVPPDDNVNAAPKIRNVRADINDAAPKVDTSKVEDFSSLELSDQKEQNVEEYKKQEKELCKKESSANYPFQETKRPIEDPIGFLFHDNSTLVDAHTAKRVLEMSGSICKLVFPIGVATGFVTGIRVGRDKVMVPVHALKLMLESDLLVFPRFHCFEETGVFAPLKRAGVFAKFGYDTSNTEPLKFYFDGEVHFWDEETDIAVVSLKHNPDGPPMPEPFTKFTLPNQEFILIGHSNGEPATIEAVKNIVKLTEETQNIIDDLRKWSLKKYGRRYDYDLPQVDSVHRLLFQSSMIHGASGSPGLVVVDGEHVAVATIFVNKYPEWLYKPDIPQSQKDQVPKNYCISQGANMFSVYVKMKSDQPGLCDEIFK